MKASKTVSLSLLIVFLSLGAYFFSHSFGTNIVEEIENFLSPCARPLSYHIGSVDARFGVSAEEFKNVLTQAEGIWETPIHKNLFEFQKNGLLVVNLVYDYRQEATERLEKLGITLDTSETAYVEIKKAYESAITTYNQKKSKLDVSVTEYQKAKNSYESEVRYWNSRSARLPDGQGAPRQEFERLQNEKNALIAVSDNIQRLQNEFNDLVNTINALVDAMNQRAHELNLTVDTYNKIGDARGEEFEEGIYKSDATGKEINIYEFDSVARLKRVLAHELGHSLGLPHVDNPKAIMYKLNQGANETLTAEDLAALKTKCGISE